MTEPKTMDFINKVFDVCAELGTPGKHFDVEPDGHRVWNDSLHSAIQGACEQILRAFDDFDEEEDLCKSLFL